MEESPPSSPPYVRDPDSHDRERSPEPRADPGHQIYDEHHEDDDDRHEDDGDHHEDDGDHLAEMDHPPLDQRGVLSDELKARIVKQVEYYFSDENLLNDKYLTKFIRKDKEGFGERLALRFLVEVFGIKLSEIMRTMYLTNFIRKLKGRRYYCLFRGSQWESNSIWSGDAFAQMPVELLLGWRYNRHEDICVILSSYPVVPLAVIASFRRMKRLVQEVAFIATALSMSTQLVVSSDAKKVKRIHPYVFPSTNNDDALSCTVLVDNLPEDHSMENIQRIFGSVGKVKHVSIRQPNSTSRAPTKNNKLVFATRGKWHAFVEYETLEAAEKAVMVLHDAGNWRTGMHVQLLVQQGKKHVPVSGGSQVATVDDDNTTMTSNTDDNHNLGTDDHHVKPKVEGLEHSLSEKDGAKGRRGGQGRGRGQHYLHGKGSKAVYVKKHDMSVSEVEVQISVDTHGEKPEMGGEHLMNEKDEHRGPKPGRGRNHMQHHHNVRGPKGSSYGNDHHISGEDHDIESQKTRTQATEVEENIASERGGWGARWRGRGRGHGHHHVDAGAGHGSSSGALSGTNETTIKHHAPVPKMPDGTRGFTIGRGRPPSTVNAID